MLNKSSNVYVIIVTYNGEKWIRKCLDSVICSAINVNIIVIDNASSDNTESISSNYNKNIKFVRLSNNIGFGQANNIGFKYALSKNPDYVLLLNQDAMITPDLVPCLIKASNEYPEYGILSPMHYNYEGTRLDPGFIRYCPPNLLNDGFCDNLKQIYETEFVNAAVWFLKSEVLKTVGGFDPVFFHGGEDDDFVQRTRYLGYKIGLVPKLKAYHSHESFGFQHEYTFSEKCNKQYNSCVINLKRPDNNFCYAFCKYIIKLLSSIIFGTIMFNYDDVMIKVRVALKIFPSINTIAKHRKMLIRRIALPIPTCVGIEDQ